MPALLPLICFILTLQTFIGRKKYDFRESFIFAAVIWGGLVAAVVEILSLYSQIEFWPLTLFWLVASLLALGVVVKGRRCEPAINWKLQLTVFSRFENQALLATILLLFVVGILALVAPPNTWDSMTYHMGRIIHWLQNKNVEFYPTHISRQLYQNPWSEFAILNFQILTGGDRLANFVQYFSMLGSVLGVSLIAKSLGAAPRGQVFAAVVCATIPMGILQGSSTQSDYVCAFWLVCFVALIPRLVQTPTVFEAFLIGTALGLSVLTKATGYIYGLPFVVYLILATLQAHQIGRLVHLALVFAPVVLLNLGHYWRNYSLYNNPLGPGSEGGIGFSNEAYSLPITVSNLLRSIGLHLGTPIKQINLIFEKIILFMHEALSISANDPRSTWGGGEFHIIGVSTHEDSASNVVHLFLILAAIGAYLYKQKQEKWPNTYIILLFCAMALFCVYPKWQPWHSRLHLPLFVLWAPFVGYVLANVQNHKLANKVIVLVLVCALPALLFSSTKPFFPKISNHEPYISAGGNIFARKRIDQYFNERPNLVAGYRAAVAVVAESNCNQVGLVIGSDDWEYPLWALLNEKNPSSIHLEHVNVQNLSARLSEKMQPKIAPCTILMINSDLPESVVVNNATYARKWSADSIALFK